MKHCILCGKIVDSDDEFCPYCGEKLEGNFGPEADCVLECSQERDAPTINSKSEKSSTGNNTEKKINRLSKKKCIVIAIAVLLLLIVAVPGRIFFVKYQAKREINNVKMSEYMQEDQSTVKHLKSQYLEEIDKTYKVKRIQKSRVSFSSELNKVKTRKEYVKSVKSELKDQVNGLATDEEKKSAKELVEAYVPKFKKARSIKALKELEAEVSDLINKNYKTAESAAVEKYLGMWRYVYSSTLDELISPTFYGFELREGGVLVRMDDSQSGFDYENVGTWSVNGNKMIFNFTSTGNTVSLDIESLSDDDAPIGGGSGLYVYSSITRVPDDYSGYILEGYYKKM